MAAQDEVTPSVLHSEKARFAADDDEHGSLINRIGRPAEIDISPGGRGCRS
jgi:hypothetical protein